MKAALAEEPRSGKPGAQTATPKPVATLDPQEYGLDGLYIAGQVIGRQRRIFDAKGGTKRYVIALTILTATGVYKPERWCDSPTPSDVPTQGEHVCLKCGLTVYQSKATNYRLTWGADSTGESF